MKTLTKLLITTAAVFALSTGVAAADHLTDRKEIETVLSTYEKALNASDADTVMTLYADDGVFMAQHSVPNVGKEAVRATYRRVRLTGLPPSFQRLSGHVLTGNLTSTREPRDC